MEQRFYLGIDNGGTLTKAVLFDAAGHEVAQASESVPLLTPAPGFTERDMEALYAANCRCIRRVAEELVMYQRCGVVVNRLEDPAMASELDLEGLELLAAIPADKVQAKNDIRGKSVFELPSEAAILSGAAACLTRLGILPSGTEKGKEV